MELSLPQVKLGRLPSLRRYYYLGAGADVLLLNSIIAVEDKVAQTV